jgi:glutaredoxin
MAVKLHRCSDTGAKDDDHACWRVQQALDAAGIEYELVSGPDGLPEREAVLRLSGQRLYPVIEFDDGRVYREDSIEMAERIRAGELSEVGLISPHAERPGEEPAAT